MRNRWKSIRERSTDDGLSLIEVLVAMMIFSMLVVGIGYSLITVMQLTRDSQARETAISIASSELDAVRAIGNPFEVHDAPAPGDPPRITTVGNNSYTIVRTTRWANAAGSIDTCGSGGAPLQYKAVSVTVGWAGMREGAQAVRTDTALVPTSRINDPTKGTILVAVKDDAGLGVSGVTFTASSPGGSLVTEPTNVDGCSFLLGVAPGDYTIKLTSTNYMDTTQTSNPELIRTVEAGSAAEFSYQYDKRGTYLTKYASNDLDPGPLTIPNNLTTTFFNSNGRYTTQVSTTGLNGVQYLYPAQAGYEVVAGSFVPTTQSGTSCEAVDPAAWEATTTDPPALGTRAPNAYTPPGGSSAITPVPMGILKVQGDKNGRYLYAESQPVTKPATPMVGQPTCDISIRYDLGSNFTSSSTTISKIALPFGTWKLYVRKNTGSSDQAVLGSQLELLTPGVIEADGTFTLDPRGVTP